MPRGLTFYATIILCIYVRACSSETVAIFFFPFFKFYTPEYHEDIERYFIIESR